MCVCAIVCVFACLLLFYVLATSKVIAGQVATCDSAHSWQLLCNSTLGDGNSRDYISCMVVVRPNDRLSAVGDRQSAIGDRQSAIGSRRLAIGSRRSAVGDRQATIGDRQSAIGCWQSAIGGRRSAVGDRDA